MIAKIRIILIVLLALASFSAVLPTTIRLATAVGNWPTCGAPTVITLAQMQADPSALNQISAPGDPNAKRSLTPPCSAYYELDGMTIASTYTGECGLLVTGVCDVHLQFNCTYGPGCLFEIDQTWLGAGYQYPRGCKTAGGAGQVGVCVSNGDVVSARGFFYIDDHSIHEFHPVSEIVKAASFPVFTFNYVVTILMENQGVCDIITTCGGSGAYETTLANTYAKAGTCQSDSSCSVGGYRACCHNSQGNYVALLSGGSNINSNTLPDGYCCFNLNAPNLVDKIESGGLTWQAWAEGATGSGCGFRPPRQADHFPFISFTDMQTTARCANFHTTSGSNDNSFINMLSFANASSLMWLTPNDNNNGHDTGVSGGDNWLSGIVPRILASPLFSNAANKAALFIQYDEGNSGCSSPCNSSTNDYIYATWAGTPVKQGYTGTGSYSHGSWASTMEAAWGMSCIGNAAITALPNDCNVLAMSEFFGASAPPAGNFDSTWYIQNCPGGTETISNGVLQTREVTPGGSSNNFGFCTAQRGTFPWGSTVGTTLPTGITSVSVSLIFLARTLSSGSRYHLYIALYYQIPSSTANGKTYTWLDTQSRAENINGANTAIGTTATYDPGDSFGYDKVTLIINPGQSGNITADEVGLASGDLAAWGLPANTPYTLRGVEIGSEGFLIPQIDANWFTVTFATGPPPPPPTLTADFSFSPSSPIVGQSISFTSIVTGGTFPYTYAWTFGDTQTSTAQNPSHSYSSPNTYTVSLTVKDAGSPQQTAPASHSVTVAPQPPAPDFSISVNPSSVSFNSGTTGAYTTMIASINGFSGTVNLAEQSNSAGLSSACSPTFVTNGAGSSACTLASSTPGSYTVTVTGTSGSLSHSAIVLAFVTTPPPTPGYTIFAVPSSLSISQGSSGTSTITVTSQNGFSDTLSLTVAVTPSGGPAAGLNPTSIILASGGTGTSILTITVASTIPIGFFSATVTSTGSMVTHTASISITVTQVQTGPTVNKVTPCAGCHFGTPLGALTPITSAQLYRSARGFGNGTMIFNVTGLEVAQGVYYYTAQSFGNGTMVLEFLGAKPVNVQTAGLTFYQNGIQTIVYTAAQTSQLTIAYTGAPPPPPPPPPGGGGPPIVCATCAAISSPFDTGVVGIAVVMTVIAMGGVVFFAFKRSKEE